MEKKRTVKKISINLAAAVFLCVCLAGPVFAQQTVPSQKKKETRDEFETRKAEWEKIRDQQIELLREKEEELERLKESLFRQMHPENSSSPAVPVTGTAQPGPSQDLLPTSEESVLKKKIFDLKNVNRQLADENSAYVAQNRKLKEELARLSSGGKSELLDSERRDFETQKKAFQQERKKFFQEMIRQKKELQQMEDSIREEKAALDLKARSEALTA